ncbi:hypothetical protein CR513_14599, partial [Mucuna pruriens]
MTRRYIKLPTNCFDRKKNLVITPVQWVFMTHDQRKVYVPTYSSKERRMGYLRRYNPKNCFWMMKQKHMSLKHPRGTSRKTYHSEQRVIENIENRVRTQSEKTKLKWLYFEKLNPRM